MYNSTYKFPAFIGISDQVAISSLNKYQEYDTIWLKQLTDPVIQYLGPSITSWFIRSSNATVVNVSRVNIEL